MLFSNGVLAPAVAGGLFVSPGFLSETGMEGRLLPTTSRHQLASFYLDNRPSQIRSGSWSWDGTEIYATDFKIGRSAREQNITWYAGFFPHLKSDLTSVEFSEGHSWHAEDARHFFAEKMRLGSWQVPLPAPIFVQDKGEFKSWWKLQGQNGRTFWVRESDRLWGEEPPVILQATATAALYQENKYASESSGLVEVELTDLIDVSYLRNKFFRVLNCMDGRESYLRCGSFARSLSGYYSYPFESPEHSEMVAYYSLQKAMAWHRGIQSDEQKIYFGDFGLSAPIDVFVRTNVVNAPYYTQRSTLVDSVAPVIFINSGEEPDAPQRVGTNNSAGYFFLSKDSDVYFHEFSHHVLFRAVRPFTDDKTKDVVQPRAIQEGMADYFTYAITGNNKLGESIYQGKPLRQGTSTESLTSDLLAQRDFYAIGEQLSSVYWGLRQKLPKWRGEYNQIDKVAWDAIDLLPQLATFYQLACATYVSALAFEKRENLAPSSVASVVAAEFVDRGYFASTSVNGNESCPQISDVLKAFDAETGDVSSLPKVTPPTTPVTFTGETRDALAPFGGSLYQPVQPKRTFCGDLVLNRQSRSQLPMALLIPIFFIGSMLGRWSRWRHRSRKTRHGVEAK